MKAILVDQSTKNLKIEQVAPPSPKSDEVLIKVKACGVNRADLLQRAGSYPVPKGVSEVLGLEVSGIIEEVGDAVRDFRVGERVFCLLSAGGYAEYAVVGADQLMRIPQNLDYEKAAAIPEAYFTAYLNLILEGALIKDETLLVHAAASGVGVAAIHIARALGADVIATAGSDQKCEFAKSQGANDCINYKAKDFLAYYGEERVDLILDMVGARHFEKNIKLLKYRGRMIMLSVISGAKSEINLLSLLRKNLMIKGSTLRNRSNVEKSYIRSQFENLFLPLFADNRISPCVSKVFKFEEAQEAHAFVEQDLNLGKVILSL